MIFVLQMVFDVAWQRNGSAVVKLALHPAGCGVSNHGFFKGRNCRANARSAIHPHPISGPPTLVKQDVKVSSPKAMRERECSLAVAEGRTNLSELARLNSENEARLERGKTTAKSLPDPHPFPRSCGVRSSRFSSCERPIHQSLRAVGVHLLNLKTVESTLSQIRRRRARGTSGLWPSSP